MSNDTIFHDLLGVLQYAVEQGYIQGPPTEEERRQRFIDAAAMRFVQGALGDPDYLNGLADKEPHNWAYDMAEALWTERQRRIEQEASDE